MALSKRGKDEETFYRGWEEEEALKGWVQPVAGDESKAACRFCECEMRADYTDLQQHAATAEHRNRAPLGSSVPLANEGVCASNGSGSATTLFKRTEASHSSTSSPETEDGETDEIMVGNGVGNSDAAFRFSTAPTLEDIRRLQSAFATERGWGKYHQPRNLLLALVGEVGELAELFQWREEAPEGLPGWTVSERDALSDELSDVLIYLVALADKCHVDLPSAARRKIEKNRLKYPAEKVYGSSKKYTEYQK